MAIQDQDQYLHEQNHKTFVAVPTNTDDRFFIELDQTTFGSPAIPVEGCPVMKYKPPCHRCSGFWPGTTIGDKQMTDAINSLAVDPEKLGCGTLTDRAKNGLRQIEKQLFPVGY